MKVFNLTIVFNNKVENIVIEKTPNVGDLIIVNGLELSIKQVVLINTINDSINEIGYYTCICELNDIKRIDEPQVKIIGKAEIEKLLVNIYDFHDDIKKISLNFLI